MSERAGSSDVDGSILAARAAVAPWLATLADLKRWFDENAVAIWPEGSERRAKDLLALLQETLEALARGEQAIAPGRQAPRSATDPQRIDTLLSASASARHSTSATLADQRRKAILNLGLWNVLRALGRGAAGEPDAPPLAPLHARLAAPTPPAPGLSPALAYAQTDGARRFFEQSVRRALETLARRVGGDGAGYASAVPAQAFDAGLPSLVAWSHAWSLVVAGVYLDNLQRHASDDPQQVLRDIWSGRLDGVRFRTGPGLTVLPTHAGALHLDLWTCAVKAQALAFDAQRWPAQAAGTRWHGVRVDMHELSGDAASAAGAPRRIAAGLGVESLYRAVFIDRLHWVLGQGAPLDGSLSGDAAHAQEHTIAIDMDRPRNGHVPNLKLLLRWREPAAGPLRFSAGDTETGSSAVRRDALQRWLASQGDESLAHALAPERIDWRVAAAAHRFVDAAGAELVALGHGALWRALDPAVQWIDPALVVCVDGAWYELPVVLHDEAVDRGHEAAQRTWWLLRAADPLPAGLDRAGLQQAAGSAATWQWVAHESGLGIFVMAAIDVDAWRREQGA